MLTDIQIAQSANMKHIKEVAETLGMTEDDLILYGKYKAKISDEFINKIMSGGIKSEASEAMKIGGQDGKLILVTAVNPTPAGEGKTTTTVGLGQAMAKIGKKAVIALREPSMGPVMGIKGGAAGGGYAQVVPMEDINLHFTGDMHAITAANNLLSAAIDNHIHQGNELKIDSRQILWKRCMDMNDRALRDVIVGLGGKANGFSREDGFNITVASEVMAILCLATDIKDLKSRLGRIIVAYNLDGNPVICKDLKMEGAMTLLLKDAIQPNLVQTLENTPCLMHGGPFANIAHGCNSITATKLAMKIADYAITEAGFGADLGAEKFFDIKCRAAGIKPSAVIIVATVRALKYNGGVAKDMLAEENLEALSKGIVNLEKHISNMKKFNVPVLVAINHFYKDTDKEIKYITDRCAELGAPAAVSKVFAEGGAGGIELAQKLVDLLESEETNFSTLYDLDLPIKEKIEKIVKEIYGAKGVVYQGAAEKALKNIDKLGYANLPICMAKTQYSFSDNPALLGRPEDFEITVRDIKLSAGAGFIVVLTGDIMTMPGLPKVPSAEKIDILENGEITGLF